jgi:hypothetical protein
MFLTFLVKFSYLIHALLLLSICLSFFFSSFSSYVFLLSLLASPFFIRSHNPPSVPGATFAFSIYDFEGNGTVDAFYVGDILRGLNLNPTLAVIEKMGGTKKRSKYLVQSSWDSVFQ